MLPFSTNHQIKKMTKKPTVRVMYSLKIVENGDQHKLDLKKPLRSFEWEEVVGREFSDGDEFLYQKTITSENGSQPYTIQVFKVWLTLHEKTCGSMNTPMYRIVAFDSSKKMIIRAWYHMNFGGYNFSYDAYVGSLSTKTHLLWGLDERLDSEETILKTLEDRITQYILKGVNV